MNTLLFSQNEQALGLVRTCAVAIGGDINSRHTGLFYRDPDQGDRLYLLHLVTPGLRNDDANLPACGLYLWGHPDLPPAFLGDMAAKAILIRDNNPRLIYGFSIPDDFFDKETGKMVLGPDNIGLTCATLILAIFHLAGITLVDYKSWHDRPEDKAVQDELIDFIETNKQATPAEIVKIKEQANGFRYRPEEVIAAALIPENRNSMNNLIPLGEEVVRKILNA